MSCVSPVTFREVIYKPIIMIYVIYDVAQGTLEAFQGLESFWGFMKSLTQQ